MRFGTASRFNIFLSAAASVLHPLFAIFVPVMTRLLLIITLLAALCAPTSRAEVTVGAARTDLYLPALEGKRVGLLTNHTGMVGNEHTLDLMLRNGVDVRMIFSPEHGFRGTADAGEHVSGGRDAATGLPIVSLFGSRRFPTDAMMDSIDIIVTDIQDVGLRFYTYYCTMLDLMNSAAARGKQFMILDRPNPNGMTVDGPLLDMRFASGVGRLPIPVLHGLTLGELGRMAVGEGWLDGKRSLDLTVIPCGGYTHATRYELPVPPSPNLPDMKSVYLYPSVCFFEATPMSLGRGTDMPFCVIGHPALKDKPGCSFSFTPRSRPGARKPPLMDRRCYGMDLRSVSDSAAIAGGVDLSYLIEAYRLMGRPAKFLTSFFEKLIGTDRIRPMIERGDSAEAIRASWQPDVEAFCRQRAPYLIYPLD